MDGGLILERPSLYGCRSTCELVIDNERRADQRFPPRCSLSNTTPKVNVMSVILVAPALLSETGIAAQVDAG